MKILYKDYVDHNGQEIKRTIHFNKEATNWATGQPKTVGYNVTFVPVKRTFHEGYVTEQSEGFSGFNICLLPVGRQSSKRLSEATQKLHHNSEELLKLL